MFYRSTTNKDGTKRYSVLDRYTDPLTGKLKTASVSYKKNTSRARKQAERELADKINDIIEEREGKYNVAKINTFGELKNSWLESWSATVKPQTVEREKLVLRRLGDIVGDDFLLDKITPLLVKNSLSEYAKTYDASVSTMQHIKSTLNKVFDHGVLYKIIDYSPMISVRLDLSVEKKKETRVNRERKFLEIHELVVFFDALGKRRNLNYYDLGIFLLFSGLRIGEASSITEEDIDFEKGSVNVNKSLQTTNLRVSEFYYDDTKTVNSEREVLLPKVAIEALKRVVERSREFDEYAKNNPNKNFKKSESIFRTEYGAPITSHSFREVLYRVRDELIETTEEKHGFKWTKNVVPHSFRHMHITYLQSGELDIALREIMGRVGHVNSQTTMIYTHRTLSAQEKSISVLDDFAESSGLNFKILKNPKSKYSNIIYTLLEKERDAKRLELSLDDFRENLGIKETHAPRDISSNILPKVKNDLEEYYDGLQIETLRGRGRSVLGYVFTWN